MYKNQADNAEERNKELQIEKYRLEQKLKHQENENNRLQMIIDEGGDESEGTKMIKQKERELKELKELHLQKHSSRERETYGERQNLYNAQKFSTPDGKLSYNGPEDFSSPSSN